MLPRVLKNFNYFVDGSPLLGIATEVTLPSLSMQADEHRAGGMLAPVDLDMGLEKLTAEYTLKEFHKETLALWGVADASGVRSRFLGAAEADDGETLSQAIEVAMRGRITKFDFGTVKAGEPNEAKVSQSLTYLKYMVDGQALIEIDVVNMIHIVNGVDRLAARRTALSI
jgi:hypothetical protein